MFGDRCRGWAISACLLPICIHRLRCTNIHPRPRRRAHDEKRCRCYYSFRGERLSFLDLSCTPLVHWTFDSRVFAQLSAAHLDWDQWLYKGLRTADNEKTYRTTPLPIFFNDSRIVLSSIDAFEIVSWWTSTHIQSSQFVRLVKVSWHNSFNYSVICVTA